MRARGQTQLVQSSKKTGGEIKQGILELAIRFLTSPPAHTTPRGDQSNHRTLVDTCWKLAGRRQRDRVWSVWSVWSVWFAWSVYPVCFVWCFVGLGCFVCFACSVYLGCVCWFCRFPCFGCFFLFSSNWLFCWFECFFVVLFVFVARSVQWGSIKYLNIK